MIRPAELTSAVKHVVVLAALLAGARETGAQSISVSGSPSTLRVQAAVAGSAPASVSNGSTTYTISIGNRINQKIVASINSAMPAGVTLTIALGTPSGATNLGAVALGTIAQNVISAIPKNTITTKSITYQLSATAAAGVVSVTSRTVTLTVLTGP